MLGAPTHFAVSPFRVEHTHSHRNRVEDPVGERPRQAAARPNAAPRGRTRAPPGRTQREAEQRGRGRRSIATVAERLGGAVGPAKAGTLSTGPRCILLCVKVEFRSSETVEIFGYQARISRVHFPLLCFKKSSFGLGILNQHFSKHTCLKYTKEMCRLPWEDDDDIRSTTDKQVSSKQANKTHFGKMQLHQQTLS